MSGCYFNMQVILKCNQQIAFLHGDMVPVKWEPGNFWVASCDYGNSRVVSYNTCKLWVNNQAVSREYGESELYQVCIISLQYLKCACKAEADLEGACGARVPFFLQSLFFCGHFEELQTVLTEVTLTINNAPLTYVYPSTIKTYLTPNHLFFGRQLLCYSNRKINCS